MSYRTINFLINVSGEEEKELLEEVKKDFSYIQVKAINSPFHAIVGQVDVLKLHREYELKENSGQKFPFHDEDELTEYVYGGFEEQIRLFSKKHPHHKCIYIRVDCFGGVCQYDGYVLLNGQKIKEESRSYDGHIHLLKEIDSEYNSWYFDPFTRDAFIKKGSIRGFFDFSLGPLWVILKNNYPNITIRTSAEIISIEDHHKFHIWFTQEKDDQPISISGRLYDVSSSMLDQVKMIFKDSMDGLGPYEVCLELEHSRELIVIK